MKRRRLGRIMRRRRRRRRRRDRKGESGQVLWPYLVSVLLSSELKRLATNDKSNLRQTSHSGAVHSVLQYKGNQVTCKQL